jgi:hypothetical protein
MVWKRLALRPAITNKITPAGLLSSSQPGGQPCWASPQAFSLIGHHHKHLSYLSQVVGILILEYPIQTSSAGHENTNIQRQPNQTTGALLHYPVKASGDLRKDNYLLLPYSSGSIQNCLCKNPTMHWPR